MKCMPLKYTPIFFDSFIRSNIVIKTTDHHFFKTQFFRFNQPQSKHLDRISLLPFAGANPIANMSTSFTKSRHIDTVTNLYRSENSIFFIHQKKEACWHSLVIFCEIILYYLQKLLKIFTTKEGSWGDMSSLLFRMISPLIHQLLVGGLMSTVGEFEMKHIKLL